LYGKLQALEYHTGAMAHSFVKSVLTLILFSTTALAAPAVVDPTVIISAGTIIGTATKPTNQPSLTASANAYLGVPFAKSPPERFSPPEAAAPWSAPLQAQAIKPACIQQFPGSGQSQALTKQFFNNPNGPAPEESEDCLYLNVYTPPNATPISKKAVMFWLFGVGRQIFLQIMKGIDSTRAISSSAVEAMITSMVALSLSMKTLWLSPSTTALTVLYLPFKTITMLIYPHSLWFLQLARDLAWLSELRLPRPALCIAMGSTKHRCLRR
jgi:hypothetical protein